VAKFSKEEGQEAVLQWAFIGFNLHRNTGYIGKLVNHCQAMIITKCITFKEG
jgi:hypothetical protein